MNFIIGFMVGCTIGITFTVGLIANNQCSNAKFSELCIQDNFIINK